MESWMPYRNQSEIATHSPNFYKFFSLATKNHLKIMTSPFGSLLAIRSCVARVVNPNFK